MRRLIRLPEVMTKTGLRKTQIELAVEDHRFPPPTPILEGGRAVGWFEDEIDEFIEARRQARDRVRAGKPAHWRRKVVEA
jgi:prophage regulatory protein